MGSSLDFEMWCCAQILYPNATHEANNEPPLATARQLPQSSQLLDN